jgi:hypothetical protein
VHRRQAQTQQIQSFLKTVTEACRIKMIRRRLSSPFFVC